MLERYPWPGNVRELRNVLERAALLCSGRTIRAADLGVMAAQARSEGPADAAGGLPSLNLERLERIAIEQALDSHAWHQGRAAEALGVSDRTLHRKIRTLGLTRPR